MKEGSNRKGVTLEPQNLDPCPGRFDRRKEEQLLARLPDGVCWFGSRKKLGKRLIKGGGFAGCLADAVLEQLEALEQMHPSLRSSYKAAMETGVLYDLPAVEGYTIRDLIMCDELDVTSAFLKIDSLLQDPELRVFLQFPHVCPERLLRDKVAWYGKERRLYYFLLRSQHFEYRHDDATFFETRSDCFSFVRFVGDLHPILRPSFMQDTFGRQKMKAGLRPPIKAVSIEGLTLDSFTFDNRRSDAYRRMDQFARNPVEEKAKCLQKRKEAKLACLEQELKCEQIGQAANAPVPSKEETNKWN